jgi:hypothetical protein
LGFIDLLKGIEKMRKGLLIGVFALLIMGCGGGGDCENFNPNYDPNDPTSTSCLDEFTSGAIENSTSTQQITSCTVFPTYTEINPDYDPNDPTSAACLYNFPEATVQNLTIAQETTFCIEFNTYNAAKMASLEDQYGCMGAMGDMAGSTVETEITDNCADSDYRYCEATIAEIHACVEEEITKNYLFSICDAPAPGALSEECSAVVAKCPDLFPGSAPSAPEEECEAGGNPDCVYEGGEAAEEGGEAAEEGGESAEEGGESAEEEGGESEE